MHYDGSIMKPLSGETHEIIMVVKRLLKSTTFCPAYVSFYVIFDLIILITFSGKMIFV